MLRVRCVTVSACVWFTDVTTTHHIFLVPFPTLHRLIFLPNIVIIVASFLLVTLFFSCHNLSKVRHNKFIHEPSMAHLPSKVSLACVCDPNSLAKLARENFPYTGDNTFLVPCPTHHRLIFCQTLSQVWFYFCSSHFL